MNVVFGVQFEQSIIDDLYVLYIESKMDEQIIIKNKS